MKISIKEDCGNSPKKIFIKDFIVSFSRLDSKIANYFKNSDFELILPGKNKIKSTEKAIEFFHKLLDKPISILDIISIISHGNSGSAHGTIAFKNGNILYFSFFH